MCLFMGINCLIFQKERKKYFSANWEELAALPKLLDIAKSVIELKWKVRFRLIKLHDNLISFLLVLHVCDMQFR